MRGRFLKVGGKAGVGSAWDAEVGPQPSHHRKPLQPRASAKNSRVMELSVTIPHRYSLRGTIYVGSRSNRLEENV